MKLVPQKLTRNIGRKVLLVKKNSPHIFFVGGVAGVVGSTVLACRATLKLEDTLDKIRKEVDQASPVERLEDGRFVADEERVQHFGRVCIRSGVRLGRLYGPSIAVGAVSVAALTGSHVQLVRRNAALTATVAAISKAYDDYRLRVQQAIGEERELDIYRDMREETVEIDGKKTVVRTCGPYGFSPYARLFEESNMNWKKDAELNRIFLECQQNYANHLLRSRGHLFLNEVYDALGLERSKAGQVVGWVYEGDGDGYVDFGMYEESSVPFVEGHERNVWLDFNVDGVVYDKLDDWQPEVVSLPLRGER